MLTHALLRTIPAAVLLLIIAAAPCLGADASGESPIVIKNFKFSPVQVTVSAGSSVTWQNKDEEPHTVTSYSGLFRSGALDRGDSFTFKFDKPGVYRYFCSLHPRMVGTIIVK